MKTTPLFASLFIALLSFSALAETKNNPTATKNPPLEQRQKMAELHEKMASCLRSDRAFPECRQEMMNGCKTTMGQEGCPMMGAGMGKGMGRGRSSMMDEKTTTKE